MDWFNSLLAEDAVQTALKVLVVSAIGFATAFLRELAAKMAASAGAMHAEAEGARTGAKGADKLDIAVAHARARLGAWAPREARLKRMVEGELPEARVSIAPPNGSSN